MFGDLLIVRLRAAESALRDGRIDEAYRLAGAADLRAHRRGAAVLAGLSELFLERARQHYRADRFTEALIDLDRAAAGGMWQEAIAELRDQVRRVAAAVHRQDHSHRARLDEVRRRLADGSLAAGRELLAHAAEGDPDAVRLRREIDRRAESAARMAAEAERLLAAGNWTGAAERIRRARGLDAQHEAVVAMEAALCRKVLDSARAALAEGMLGRAAAELDGLGALGNHLPARRDLGEVLRLAREAASGLRRGAFADARARMLALKRLIPGADWVENAASQLQQLDELHTSLMAGPLGDEWTLPPEGRMTPLTPTSGPAALDDTIAIPLRTPSSERLPSRLMLIVDGGGTCLLLLNQAVSIGRAACDDPADVPLISDIGERHANVTRTDEDYFLVSARDVDVAGAPTRHRLLRDGDRIVLGRKAKLTYRMPSRRSLTAVLELSDTTRMPNDVRRVLLFHQHALIGAGSGAHVPCRHAGVPLVLFERGGALWVRAKNDGHVDAEARLLPLGESVEIAGVRMVLQPWTMKLPGNVT